MRLHEFTDHACTVVNDHASQSPDMLQRMWPTDDVASALRIRKKQQSLRREPQFVRSDRRSRQRHGLVHWP